MTLSWDRLLCNKRPHRAGNGPVEGSKSRTLVRSAFDRDYGRIVFSTPFRRLSKKTQVHPFASIDFIHNRLTHSLEVASLGQTFGLSLYELLKRKNVSISNVSEIEFSSIIEAACLAHDIGNPPFGHAGEDAIKAWAERSDWSKLGSVDSADWLHYDGNAQTFRMVSNPDPRDSAYFRLTYATCGSIVKYPWAVGTHPEKDKGGCFTYDLDRFDEIMSELGLRRPDESTPHYVRHPFSFLMEAADDICYQVMDIEDAVTLHILSEDRMKRLLATVAEEEDRCADCSIQHLRGNAIHKLCNSAFAAFEKNYDAILSGEFKGALTESEDFSKKAAFRELKEEYKGIFSERSKVITEVGCYGVMDRLLTRYSNLAVNLSSAKDFQSLRSGDSKLVEMTWGRNYTEDAILKHRGDVMWWLHAATDHIVGMTDDYAQKTASLF